MDRGFLRGHTFATQDLALPMITSPGRGATLGNDGSFEMDSRGVNVATWFVFLGSSIGGSEYGFNGAGSSANSTISYDDMQAVGGWLFVSLFWEVYGDWQSRDYRFKAPVGPESSL